MPLFLKFKDITLAHLLQIKNLQFFQLLLVITHDVIT